jgi:hypothetical protein
MSQHALYRRHLPTPDFWQGIAEAVAASTHLVRLLWQYRSLDPVSATLMLKNGKCVGLKDGFTLDGTDFLVQTENVIRRISASQVVMMFDKYDMGYGGTGPA